MTSIRSRLFLILMITTGIVWISAIAWINFSTRAEVEHVLDARLTEAARMVSSLIVSQGIDPARAVQIPSDIATMNAPYDRQLSCQIWALDGALVGRSEGAPGKPLTDSKLGFSETLVDGEIWRVYAIENASLGMRVLVGDNLRVRDKLVADVIRGVALPALLVLPFLAALTWLSVRRGLSPLSAMAKAMETRTASDLSALPDNESPAEIKPMIRALNGLFVRVAAAREHERDFTAFAAHELRTPIAGLKTQAQVAMGTDNDAVRKNALRQIVVSVDRTARLVRQLTDLTNAESGDIVSPPQDLRLGQTLQMLADDIRQHHPGAAQIVIDPELGPASLPVDTSLFTLAARNLLENAVLHSPATREVTVSLKADQTMTAIAIQDCGPGIPEAEMMKVRQRFFRGRNKTAMGSGLGLAIADLALKRMGGHLHLENRQDGGLRVELQFSQNEPEANLH